MPAPTRPFWSIDKIYWLLFIAPYAAWFAMDGAEMFFFDKDVAHPTRVWFKLGFCLLLVNLVTILAWREDRRRAERGDWRIPEKTLLYLVTLGGLPGALLAMRMYRHKSSKWTFQVRVFFWAAAEAAFTFVLLPHTWSYANDARWGICLFSLLWWNLAVAEGILRHGRWRGRAAALYLAWLGGCSAVFLGLTLGGLYISEEISGKAHAPSLYVKVGILGAGALLVVFNEVWLTVKKLRGKLPGWDPVPPAEAKPA